MGNETLRELPESWSGLPFLDPYLAFREFRSVRGFNVYCGLAVALLRGLLNPLTIEHERKPVHFTAPEDAHFSNLPFFPGLFFSNTFFGSQAASVANIHPSSTFWF